MSKPEKKPHHPTTGTYTVAVVSLAEELEWSDHLPPELRYLCRVRPDVKPRLASLLESGMGIGVRTTTFAPKKVLDAVSRISTLTQHNCVLTWLPELLRDNRRPLFTDADRAKAAATGADLDADVRLILDHRRKFKQLVLVDEDNVGIGSEEQRLMAELSEIIYPLAVEYIVHRLIADNANERTETAQKILKALLIIGPIAHILEHWVRGIGKIFAASADDLLGETAEISALRGSGFTWKDLLPRFYVLVPIFILATIGAFQVEPLIRSGHELLGGALFGLSAVALSLTTAIQSVGMYRTAINSLMTEGKLHDHHEHGKPRSVWVLAIIQDFTNPARLGLLLGASLAPFAGIAAAALGLLHNGWILALVGSTESIVAGLTVVFAGRINEYRFAKKLALATHGKAMH